MLVLTQRNQKQNVQERSCGIMEEILENPGLCHIVRNISRYLDPKCLAQCRGVCHSWKDLIDSDRQWLIFQLEHIHNQEKIFIDYEANERPEVKTTIKARFPEWYTFIEEVSKGQNILRLKKIVKFMWIYFKQYSINYIKNPLHYAVADSNIGVVQLLIKSGIDLDMRNPIEWTSMHYACAFGNIEMVQLLIKHNQTFDPTSRTQKGNTIFHHAVQNSNLQVLELILDAFRFDDVRNEYGWKILHVAAEHGTKETIEFLIKSRHKLGINIEERTTKGSTILHLACWCRDMEIVNLVLKALQGINSNIDFDTQNEDQETPLHYACKNKSSDVALRLLQRFPNKIHVLGVNGISVLHYACQYGHLKLLKHIFRSPDFDIDFNVVDARGNTPLHHACSFGQFEVVKFVLENSNEKEIDILKRNNYLQTAQSLAIRKGHYNIVKLMIIWSRLHRQIVTLASEFMDIWPNVSGLKVTL